MFTNRIFQAKQNPRPLRPALYFLLYRMGMVANGLLAGGAGMFFSQPVLSNPQYNPPSI